MNRRKEEEEFLLTGPHNSTLTDTCPTRLMSVSIPITLLMNRVSAESKEDIDPVQLNI